MMENKPIKVAQVIGMAINGGTESLWMNYYRHIDKTKVQFDFLVESTSKIINKEEIESMGGRVVIIPSYKNPKKYIRELTKIFKENNYDIVHSNMSTLSVFTLKAAKKAEIKIRIAHSHSTSNKKEWKKNLLKNILRPFSKKYATHYFACSELAGRYLFGNKTFDEGKVTIINNAIEFSKFKFNMDLRNVVRNKLNIKDNEFLIGNIGRMQIQKNQLFLIDFMKEYSEKLPCYKMMIIGDGPLKNEINKKIMQYSLTDKIIILDTTHKVEEYYNAMDCFILSSLYEGLPVVGVEAQVNGLPCFFSDTITREVKLNDNSIFFNLYKMEDLFNFLSKTKKNDRAIEENKLVKWSIDHEAKRLEDIYRAIL